MTRRRLIALGAGAALLGLTALAIARPGGGESYSGGGGHFSSSGSSSHSGGGGGGAAILQLIYYIIELCFYHPLIGFPIVAAIIGFFIWSKYSDAKNKDWNSGPPVVLAPSVENSRTPLALDPLRQDDPAFSQPVFEDFVFRLYAAAHLAKTDPAKLAALGPYLSDSAKNVIAQRVPTDAPITNVIVGAQRVIGLETRADKFAISIELEANLATANHTYFVVDRWTFVRAKGVQTKPPDPKGRIFRCPNCDAPWADADAGSTVCASCGTTVDPGRFDWAADWISIRSTQQRIATLTNDVEERGTDLPTYGHPRAAEGLAALEAADPATTYAALVERITLIYDTLYAGWAKNDIAPARALVTDSLYDYMNYWLRAYKVANLRNDMLDMHITKTECAKAGRDKYYDSVTFRIWGTGKDFVVDASGNVVRGSKKKDRPYSEYWTLIRAAGRTGAPKRVLRCANCDGELKINQSGACEFCGAHVTAGEFDWVLSKIEQDDSYRG